MKKLRPTDFAKLAVYQDFLAHISYLPGVSVKAKILDETTYDRTGFLFYVVGMPEGKSAVLWQDRLEKFLLSDVDLIQIVIGLFVESAPERKLAGPVFYKGEPLEAEHWEPYL